MLPVMRDDKVEFKRRDMALVAAPYVHPKVSPVEAKPIPAVEEQCIGVEFAAGSR